MIKVANIMLGKAMGGIEQVFLDYDRALRIQNESVVSICHPKAVVRDSLTSSHLTLRALSQFDVFAAMRLKLMLMKMGVNVIITHGNRGARIAQLSNSGMNLISVSHNYNFKPLLKSDTIIAITDHMRDDIIAHKFPIKRVHRLYNPIYLGDDVMLNIKPIGKIPVIGFMGRMVPKKGADVLLRALRLLADRGIKFKAKIAGSGPEEDRLKRLHVELKLGSNVELLPWVSDKAAFFESIDVFVVPSLEEPFGVVILEAFAHSKPVIATRVSGPLEIIQHGVNGLLVAQGNEAELADAISQLLANKKLTNEISMEGFKRVGDFDILGFSRSLQRIVEESYYNHLMKSY